MSALLDSAKRNITAVLIISYSTVSTDFSETHYKSFNRFPYTVKIRDCIFLLNIFCAYKEMLAVGKMNSILLIGRTKR